MCFVKAKKTIVSSKTYDVQCTNISVYVDFVRHKVNYNNYTAKHHTIFLKSGMQQRVGKCSFGYH